MKVHKKYGDKYRIESLGPIINMRCPKNKKDQDLIKIINEWIIFSFSQEEYEMKNHLLKKKKLVHIMIFKKLNWT